MRILGIALSLGVAGCSAWPFTRQTPPVAPAAVERSRTLPYPVFETNAFARAVARGTRTRTGQPGANYWQQFARYRIDAEFVPAISQINGRENVRYFNRSPDTLRTVWIFLNQNLFAPASPRTESVPVTGGTEILRIAAAGQALAKRDTGTGYSVNGTLMRVGLAARARAGRLPRPRYCLGIPASARRRPARRDKW